MKIGIIGPGLSEIPPKGWGACEILIWQYKVELEKLGHEVIIYNNPNILKVIQEINNSNDIDFVHCQYDNHAVYCNLYLDKPFLVTTHYGWIGQQDKWDRGYYQIFNSIMNSPGIISLSDSITNLYKNKYNYKGFIKTLRNGAEFDKFKFKESSNKDAIYVGKIEHRKQQFELTKILKKHGGPYIDFVGPCSDERFEKTGLYWSSLGEWDKETLYSKLSDYSVLVLTSAGEAAPLVVPEALSAGLSVVLTPQAAANLDTSKPYIYIDDNLENIPKLIGNAIDTNHLYREEIREYAKNYFSWSVIIKEYIKIVEEYLSSCQ